MSLTAFRFKNDPRFPSVASGVVPMKLATPMENGSAVLIVQRALIDFLAIPMPNTTTKKEGIPDSFFGKETQDAVKAFQKKKGVAVDGDIGKNTMAALDATFASDTENVSNFGWAVPDAWHNAFWRNLDLQTQFNASTTLQADISTFMTGVADAAYKPFAKGFFSEPMWVAAANVANALGSITRMADAQEAVVFQQYGRPVPLLTLLDGFERFGQDNLPVDPLHKGPGNKHNMDGAQFMWGRWAAFADAAVRLGIKPDFWRAMQRAILAGFWFDGLRRPFTITSPFGPNPSPSDIRQFVRTKPDADIAQQLLAQSGTVP
jgi:peptidoglycan hydrolase-like protein with peptidoglycan-binding domain